MVGLAHRIWQAMPALHYLEQTSNNAYRNLEAIPRLYFY
jgi:hypothetical protein